MSDTIKSGEQELTGDERAARYGVGEWTDEPDRLEFQAHGFTCLLRRNNLGAWCGYVGVTPEHVWFQDTNLENADLDVHGGVTFTGSCHGKICHVAEPGEPEVFWVGFDCCHSGDFHPSSNSYRPGLRSNHTDEEYRNLEYAKNETIKLAAQAKESFAIAAHRKPDEAMNLYDVTRLR